MNLVHAMEGLMDVRKMQVYLRGVDLGNLTKAGEELGYSQSGVSHMMKSLEEEVGFSLLVRRRQGVVPTSAGEKLIPAIRELVQSNEKLEQLISGIRGLQTGTLNVGSFSSISFHWLPRMLKEFQLAYPGVTLNLMEGGEDEIEEMLKTGEIDMAFFSRQPEHTFDWIHLTIDPLMAVLPKGHPRSGEKNFPIKAFEEEPFVITAMGFDYDINRTITKNNINPEINFSCMDDLTVISMVANGLGLSILPELVLNGHEDKVDRLHLDPPANRNLGIAVFSFKTISPAAKGFIEIAKKTWGEDKG